MKPHDWTGRAHGVSHRSICWLPALPGSPWLAFYYQLGDRVGFVEPTRLQLIGKTRDEVEQLAIANMARIPASWSHTILTSTSGAVARALTCVDQPNSCERFLEFEFMRHAHAMLGSERLAVAFPQREQLIVTTLDDYPILIEAAAKFYRDAEYVPVTPMVFIVHRGVISGRAAVENGKAGLHMLARNG